VPESTQDLARTPEETLRALVEVKRAAVTQPGHVAGLHAGTPLRVAAELLLHARLADLRAAEARAARRLDVRTVHDLRVACRRLRAAVKVFGKKPLRSVDARIEHLQDALGEVRDLQLQAGWLKRHRADVARVQARLRKSQANLTTALALWTRQSEPLLLRALPDVRSRGALRGPRTRRRLRKRLRQLEGAIDQPDPLDPAAAHRIRIAAKKLRYEAELLRAAFRVEDALDALSELQTALGELHDSDVRIAEFGGEQKLARAARAERARRAAKARSLLLRFTRAAAALKREL
jgi:CHAD domain-containing protein